MPIVYIAGSYRAPSSDGVAANIQKARLAAVSLAKIGIPYICPHLNSAYFNELAPDVPDQYYLDMGIEQLSRCDALFVLQQWQQSQGTMSEINWWQKNRSLKTIFYQSSAMWKIDLMNWFNAAIKKG